MSAPCPFSTMYDDSKRSQHGLHTISLLPQEGRGLSSRACTKHGWCLLQFRSISYGLFGTEAYHKAIRRKAILYLREHRSDFEAFLGDDYDSWVKEMSQHDSWGDEVTLVSDVMLCLACSCLSSDAARRHVHSSKNHDCVHKLACLSAQWPPVPCCCHGTTLQAANMQQGRL